jgi:hypothetical protein
MNRPDRKTPEEIRAEAASLARYVADQRERDGDPEGSAIISELAEDIAAISLFHAA